MLTSIWPPPVTTRDGGGGGTQPGCEYVPKRFGNWLPEKLYPNACTVLRLTAHLVRAKPRLSGSVWRVTHGIATSRTPPTAAGLGDPSIPALHTLGPKLGLQLATT